MNNLIYRNQAIEAISKLPVKVDNLGYTWMIAGDVLKQIDDIPSAEPIERTAKVVEGQNGSWYCDGCGKWCDKSADVYCAYCGARLEWE